MLPFVVIFLFLHPAPAQHFAQFAKELEQRGISTRVESAENFVLSPGTSVVITEAGDPCFFSIHQELDKAEVRHYVYYDNPDPYVEGGYSEAVKQVLKAPVDGVIYANKHLAGLFPYPSIPLGFYPDIPSEQYAVRKTQIKKILYLGGANSVFYEEAFPLFLEIAQQLEGVEIYFRRHPRDKREWELGCVREEPLPFSEVDLVCYHQTSMIYGLVMAGIPVIQVALTPFCDRLVEAGVVSSVDSVEGFLKGLEELQRVECEKVLEAIGYDPMWATNLYSFLVE
ncbi:MAG: hypothetical protein ACKVOH_04620 [Chlamydiales bacterium]